MWVYAFDGTTFTRLTFNGAAPYGNAMSVAVTPSGSHVAVGLDTSPFIMVFAINGTTLTKVTTDGFTGVPQGSVRGLAWNAAGTVLAAAHWYTTNFSVYSFNGSVLTKMPDPATLPPANGYSVAVGPGTSPHITVGFQMAPSFYSYSLSGTTLTRASRSRGSPQRECRRRRLFL